MDKGYAAWAAHWRVPLGFLLGVAYLVFAQPTLTPLLSGAVVVLAGLLIRAWAAGCLDKNQSLATGGPYAHTRNPLYFGSLVMGAGFAVAGASWILGLAVVVLFLLVYWPVMRREEALLREQFGETFLAYANLVPFFFPALRSRTRGGAPFRWAQYGKNREYQAALGSAALIVFLAVKMILK
jgi:protein-S-isoprenylcysteine O-methyltransferase Ste14